MSRAPRLTGIAWPRSQTRCTSTPSPHLSLCSDTRDTILSLSFVLCLRLTRVYGLYADYVLKNPFYELDMPIRCELFDLQLTSEVTLTMNA